MEHKFSYYYYFFFLATSAKNCLFSKKKNFAGIYYRVKHI